MANSVKIVFAALAVWYLLSIGGKVEGLFFPVVDRAELTQIDAQGETHSLIYGEAEKLRDCRFHSLEWRLGSPRSYVVVDVSFRDEAVVRSDGDFTFGPWYIQLSPEKLGRSFAIVRHRCHQFWLVESAFYP